MVITEEHIFISVLLQRNEYINLVASKIKPEYIQDDTCKKIYQSMLDEPEYTLPSISKATGIKFAEILELADQTPANRTILDTYGYWILNNYKQAEIKKLANNTGIDDVSARIDELKSLEYYDAKEINESDEFLKNVEDRYSGKEDLRNVKTGYTNIDGKIDGFRNSELVIIGGRPASGKTTFGMNIAYNMAKEGKNVLFCSLEMGKIELHERLCKSITKISDYEKMTPQQFDKLIKVSKAIKERLKLTIYDKPSQTIENIFFVAKQKKYDVVFIDHLSILKSSKSFKSRYEEVSYLSARLKVLARELDIPVVCLCQLNRALESREIKAPTMADLRDSGSIEQDADLISFVYRPEYHLKQLEPDDQTSKEHEQWQEQLEEVKGKAQVIFAKNRRGFTGKFKFGFDAPTYTFFESNSYD